MGRQGKKQPRVYRSRGGKTGKGHSPFRRPDSAKRLRFWLIIFALILVAALVACGYLLWRSLPHPADDTESTVSQPLAYEDTPLPVYDDAFSLVLVNATHEISPAFTVNLGEVNGVQIEERIVRNLKKMLEDAEKDGCKLKLTRGYVSREEQTKRYEAKIQEFVKQGSSQIKAEEETQKLVDKGGFSEYQTGLAFDLTKEGLADGADFTKTDEYRWLIRNGISYGFVLRNPEEKESQTGMQFDPHHFRYVGIQNAKKMRALGMCLEEYAVYVYRQENW